MIYCKSSVKQILLMHSLCMLDCTCLPLMFHIHQSLCSGQYEVCDYASGRTCISLSMPFVLRVAHFSAFIGCVMVELQCNPDNILDNININRKN